MVCRAGYPVLRAESVRERQETERQIRLDSGSLIKVNSQDKSGSLIRQEKIW